MTYQKPRQSLVGVNELLTLQLSLSHEWKPVLSCAIRECNLRIPLGIVWYPAATLASDTLL